MYYAPHVQHTPHVLHTKRIYLIIATEKNWKGPLRQVTFSHLKQGVFLLEMFNNQQKALPKKLGTYENGPLEKDPPDDLAIIHG